MTTATVPVKQENGEPVAEATRAGRFYRPNVDIAEFKEELTAWVDLPGVRGEDIDIQFEQGALTLHAKTHDRHAEKANWLLNEYGVGDYYRTFRVSEAIDPSRISGEYKNGVLTLHLPKVDAVKPRRITVQTAE